MEYNLIFTLDYEIHGNGDGDPLALMVEPTNRLMDLLEQYHGKLTILVDVAEVLCFKEYYEAHGEDKFSYLLIEEQLKDALHRGHDVQLHIHSSYFGSQYNGKQWSQAIENYNMAALPYSNIYGMVQQCKDYLESLLKPIDTTYRCRIFRAANWSMMPTPDIYDALISNGIEIDSSVYKGGHQGGNVDFDYRSAYSNWEWYKASSKNINQRDDLGKLYEFPIYCEMCYFWSFITPIRLLRMLRARLHKHKQKEQVIESSRSDSGNLSLHALIHKNPRKYDFNQLSGSQMISCLKRIKRRIRNNENVSIVLIGHSKTFIKYNEKTLEKFLRYVSKQSDVRIDKFPQIENNDITIK